MARASRLLPVPLGPASRMPRGGRMPASVEQLRPRRRGSSIAPSRNSRTSRNPADVLPRHVRLLDQHLAGRRRLDRLERLVEVAGVDAGAPRPSRSRSTASRPASSSSSRRASMPASLQSTSRSAPTKPWVISASRSRSTSSAIGKPAAVDAQDLEPAVGARGVDGDLAVEPARAAQGRVDQVRHVGGADDGDLPARDQAVHQRQELGHHPLLDVADDVGPLRGDRVDLVQEDDRRRLCAGPARTLHAGVPRTRRRTSA